MTTPPPIESTGEKLTDEQRRQADIAECRRQIVKYEEKLRVLKAKAPSDE